MKIGHTINVKRTARFKPVANTLLSGQPILSELTYLVAHELKVRGVRTNPLVTSKQPLVSKHGAMAHSNPVKGKPVECAIEYELPHISSQELTHTIQQFTTDYLLDAARDIADFIAERGRGKMVSMAPMQLPGGLEWAEKITDPAAGIELRLCRGYDIMHNLMWTSVSARYLVSN